MMQLEHINMFVKDIPTSLEFYKTAFPHWRVRGGDKDLWHGKPRRWAHFGDDYFYLCFNDKGEGSIRDHTSLDIGMSHFAYLTNDINALKQRLSERGFEPYKPGADDPYRSNVYYLDPDGFEVEFVQYHSDLPTQRNRYNRQAGDWL